jgi:hypothetical protein
VTLSTGQTVTLYAGRYDLANYGIKGACRPGLSVNAYEARIWINHPLKSDELETISDEQATSASPYQDRRNHWSGLGRPHGLGCHPHLGRDIPTPRRRINTRRKRAVIAGGSSKKGTHSCQRLGGGDVLVTATLRHGPGLSPCSRHYQSRQ